MAGRAEVQTRAGDDATRGARVSRIPLVPRL